MESKIAELEPKISEKDKIKADLESKISEKEKEIESLKAELEPKIAEKEKEIESLKAELEPKISVKDTEIASLKNDLEVKVNQINELNDKISSFDAQISDAEGAPNVIEQIKELMKTKGFLSDREFEDLLKQ